MNTITQHYTSCRKVIFLSSLLLIFLLVLFIFLFLVVVALPVCVIVMFSYILLLTGLLTLLYFFSLFFFKCFFHFSLFYSLVSPYSSFSNSLFPPSLSYCLLPVSTLSTYSYSPPPWSSSVLCSAKSQIESF